MLNEKGQKMTKVRMFCYSRFILVDEDQVKKHIKKDALVNRAQSLQKILKDSKDIQTLYFVNKELEDAMKKMRSLNRTIRQNVQFVA